MQPGPISTFIERHFRHFNAATLKEAAIAYQTHVNQGGKMFLAMAGAMSTAELGLSLAEMIRQDKFHAITCTGANLEEDLFNLVAHNHYKRIQNYRNLTATDDAELLKGGLNRVTDTCIPEEEAMAKVESALLELWQEAHETGTQKFPHEFLYELINSGTLADSYQIDPRNSWLCEAAKANLPLFVPGWEDCTLGNMFAARCINGEPTTACLKHGVDYMLQLAQWYVDTSAKHPIGFFQIGGGIAGDFPICVVPLLRQDVPQEVPLWAYFCQISDSTTSYGSYSGATPNEKISWEKLDVDTPSYVIESDATIVAPLIFAYVLGW